MQYMKNSNSVTKHIKALNTEMNGENAKVFYGDKATAMLKDYTNIDSAKVRTILSQNKKCAQNVYNLGWTMKCQSSQREHSSHYNEYTDNDCLGKLMGKKDYIYMDCVKQASDSGVYAPMKMQECMEFAQNWQNACKRREKVEDEYDTCEGERKLIVENGYDDIVLIVPSFKQPDFNEIPYKRVVQALMKKFGPARSSHQKITPNDEKWEVFYWQDGAWIVQVEIKVSGYTDDATVYHMDTYYMNFSACIAQQKFEEEKKQKEIAAQKAEEERARKAKEDKIKNFEL